jgi:hypothetical protein
VILTTGDGATPETQRFLREKGVEVLLKPCGIREIEPAIAHVTTRGADARTSKPDAAATPLPHELPSAGPP